MIVLALTALAGLIAIALVVAGAVTSSLVLLAVGMGAAFLGMCGIFATFVSDVMEPNRI